MIKANNWGNDLLYQTPLAFSCIFAGAGIYTSEGDPSVRLQLKNTKQQLAHWSKMYAWGFRYMQLFVIGGTVSALTAYYQSK